jgi:hypothetical protein
LLAGGCLLRRGHPLSKMPVACKSVTHNKDFE